MKEQLVRFNTTFTAALVLGIAFSIVAFTHSGDLSRKWGILSAIWAVSGLVIAIWFYKREQPRWEFIFFGLISPIMFFVLILYLIFRAIEPTVKLFKSIVVWLKQPI